MATGFIYVVDSTKKDYTQRASYNVPTPSASGDLLYFGPCKRRMRPRMNKGDYIFGISSSKTQPRRIVFAARINDCITFAEAYHRYPALHGPDGPIHVRPIEGAGTFPRSSYEHIAGSMHRKKWERDLASPKLDRFFICCPQIGGSAWLGASGPAIDRDHPEILDFLNSCHLNGNANRRNNGSWRNPIAEGGQYRGLHLETQNAEKLLEMCASRTSSGNVGTSPPVTEDPGGRLKAKSSHERLQGCR